jgi:hypothetical protein
VSRAIWRKPIILRMTQDHFDRVDRVRGVLAKQIYKCAPEEVYRSTILRWLVERGLELTEQEFCLPKTAHLSEIRFSKPTRGPTP